MPVSYVFDYKDKIKLDMGAWMLDCSCILYYREGYNAFT